MFDMIAYSNDSAFLESFPQQLGAKFAEYAPRLVRVRGISPAQLSLFEEDETPPDLYMVHLGDDPEEMMEWLEHKRLTARGVVMLLAPGPEWAMRAYENEVQYYQVCPPNLSRIAEMILRRFALRTEKLAKQLPQAADAAGAFPVRTAEGTQVLLPEQILYVEYSDHRLRVYLANGTCQVTTTMRQSFTTATEPLLKEPRFVRTHASFVVNIAHVVQFGNYALTLDNGFNVPISHAKKPEVKRKFHQFFDAAQ